MKSRRHFKKKNNRKSLRGGFFSNNKVTPSEQCDVNKLTELKTVEEMHKNYQECCPKGMFGTKNSSAYCKQLDLNFKGTMSGENNARDPNETQPPPVEIHQSNAAATLKTPWYKFWGGKKTKRRNNNNKKRKYSKKYRK